MKKIDYHTLFCGAFIAWAIIAAILAATKNNFTSAVWATVTAPQMEWATEGPINHVRPDLNR